MSRKACLISCSDHYAHRLHTWDKGLSALGYSTQYITSDFDHSSKSPFVCSVPDCVQLHVLPYRKNLSWQRIVSHYQFAKRVVSHLEHAQPDMIVALLPPNFLAKFLADYKRKHPQVRLIFDIFDLWPETFPSGKAKKLLAPAFSVWAGLRDRNLGAADYITTECDLFRELLRLERRCSTLYLDAKPVCAPVSPQLPADTLSLCYLGSINNIIDIPRICALIRDVADQRKVRLHIIGRGERQQELIDSATASGAEVVFHGPIFDDADKQRIMDSCHFGLNILKSSVCIGLTMKSVDYLRHGLPIINTVPGDTHRLVSQQIIGVSYDKECARRICSLSQEEILAMRQNASRVFDETFSESVILNVCGDILAELERQK
jgi:glycosyltransferase involved in cell wall biosynthesis